MHVTILVQTLLDKLYQAAYDLPKVPRSNGIVLLPELHQRINGAKITRYSFYHHDGV